MKILVAVHGNEPAGWVRDVIRYLALPAGARVRVLVVLNVPTPPFTSLTPWAHRLYGAALAGWREQEAERTRGSVADLLERLGSNVEVVRVQASDGETGRAIARHATRWPADLVLVGADCVGRLERALLGSVHETVLRHVDCPVLVISCRQDNDRYPSTKRHKTELFDIFD